MEQAITFESASAELDQILQVLSAQDTPLEQALALYARSAELISFCNSVLQSAQMKIEEIEATLPQI